MDGHFLIDAPLIGAYGGLRKAELLGDVGSRSSANRKQGHLPLPFGEAVAVGNAVESFFGA